MTASLNRKEVFIYFLLFSFFTFFNGCEYLSSDAPVPQPLDGGLEFNISEYYDNPNVPGIPVLQLGMATRKIYGCVNYRINAETNISFNKIDVSVNGIEEPNICLTALGPATYGTILNIPDGSYQLTIHSVNFYSNFDISINDASIEITSKGDNQVQARYNLILRYPKNSFAYMCGSLPEDSLICKNFLDTLKSKIDLQEFNFPPNGKIPFPTAVDGYYYNAPVKYFYYKTESDFNKISGILKDYKENYLKDKTGYGIWIQSWLNKYISSWTI